MAFRKMMLLAFALALLLPSASALSSYGQTCATDADCVSPLKCDNTGTAASYKCSQIAPSSVKCEIVPQVWKWVPKYDGGASSNTVGQSISALETGNTQGGSVIDASSGLYKAGWFSDWKISALIGVMAAILLISIAAMVGYSFNINEVKAFVDVELMQCVVSVLLIGSIIGMMLFFDVLAGQIVGSNSMIPVHCTSNEPCYITAAKTYLDKLYEIGNSYAKDALMKSVNAQASANAGITNTMNAWYFGFAGTNLRLNAGRSIEAERAGAVFDSMSKMLASIYAQKYFIDVVSFGLAPILLLLGILLRTFFFTRKLGGLLLAIALSLFIVYPLTYAFAWYTLNVTVYGERNAVPESDCPSECTMRPPVAFYVNKTTGGLIQFLSSQDLLRAGINETNWESGDIDDDGTSEYPGLVACTDLQSKESIEDSGAGIVNSNTLTDTSKNWISGKFAGHFLRITGQAGGGEEYTIISNTANTIMTLEPIATGASNQGGSSQYEVKKKLLADNNCKGCPEQCRETPFPQYSAPGCDIAACSDCNPGCKVMRIRTDCSEKCSSSSCPAGCKASLPFENKCYATSDSTLFEANLTVDCSVCEGCPAWCLLKKKNPDGTTKLVYENEAACNKQECRVCPDQCAYVSELGGEYNCEASSMCAGCPKACRIDASLLLPEHDLQQLIPNYCENPSIKSACDSCPALCKVKIPQDPRKDPEPVCYPYPVKNYQAENCNDCPDYCRFSNYDFITGPGYSALPMTGTTPKLPYSCSDSKINCDSSTACKSECKASQPPILCRESDMGSTDSGYCRKCPAETRVMLSHIDSTGASSLVAPALETSLKCNAPECEDSCKSTVVLPNEADDPDCKNYNPSGGTDKCQKCPLNCRAIFADNALLSSFCNSLYKCGDTDCPPYCKASNTAGKVCSEYVGNGIAANPQSTSQCYNVTNEYDSVDCELKTSEIECNTLASQGCMWLDTTSSMIPITQRLTPYDERDSCKQCPENFRIVGLEVSTLSIDCTQSNCPDYCRTTIQKEADGGPATCKEYIPFELPYYGCPALCRRTQTNLPPTPYCTLNTYSTCNPAYSGECTMPDAPAEICTGCFDCPLDCLYEPPVRTDCAEVCSEDALAGPISLSPDDFILKLPGAQGEIDVKNVGTFMIPALVLPLFSLVIVISFIRVLSPILGGDIDIPGLSRII